MNLLYKLFRQDPDSREGIIATTSGLGILTNVIVATLKVIIGALAHSIAIVSEGVNNFADVLSSVLTLIGSKLSGKHPDEKHPFGYGRIEYLASLIIATMILVTGVEMLISSVKLIFEPAELSISYLSLIVVAGSAVIKYMLGAYTEKMGKKADSSALVGVGLDSKNDAYASVITIVAALAFLIFHVSLDAYAGILTSLLILKAGYEIMKETIGDLLGRKGDYDLADHLYHEICETEGVLGAADMMLHNYGPDAWSGSVNLEIDHKKTVGEIYQFLHKLQLQIMHEHNVIMVFGIYAVDEDTPEAKALRKYILAFAKKQEHVKSIHAVYNNPADGRIYCDFIVDYKLRDWDGLRSEFSAYMKEAYPDQPVELTIETEFV